MKKAGVLIYFIIFCVGGAYCQKEFDNWFFGIDSWVSFVSGNPINMTGSGLNTGEGCSSVSDSAGNVLFYTDGVFVYNSNHQLMPNGLGLYGGWSSTQSALVIPDPANANLYYIFTVDQFGGTNGFCYSKVDMTLQGGLGDVTLKNIQLLTPIDEKLTVVQNATCTGYWVAVHKLSSNSTSYYVYPVTASGIGAPVISSVGVLNSSLFAWTGCMKFSPDGTMIANCLYNAYKTEIAYFDNSTGKISNPFLFSPGWGNDIYSLEF